MRIYIFTTWHPDGLGAAKNEACAIVPNPDDWVCLVDADVMLLPPWAETVQEALRLHPEFDVYTCMATRTWAKGVQQMQGGIRENPNLKNLRMAVAQQSASFGPKVVALQSQVSGFFLLFRKKLWLEFPFKTDGWNGYRSLGVETEWIQRIRGAGKSVGLMLGVAAIHYYRMVEGDQSKDHLK